MQDARQASPGGLPSPADLFVGREGELEDVSRMLADPHTRLVTLTGPPGIGKTRLAVACASAHAERSGCAPVFVDLLRSGIRRWRWSNWLRRSASSRGAERI
jgi:hypothetical protein